jgi:hypothetical protein
MTREIHSNRRGSRRATSSLDLLVSFTLLITVMSVATPMVVRHGRLLRSQRDYRLALDELSNQLERLSALPAGELPTAVAEIAPSSFVAQRLPGAKLSGELEPAELGVRLTLRLSWNDGERHQAPLSLAAWVFPDSSRSDAETEGNPE